MFCFLDVLLRCMYGRFYGDLIFSDFVLKTVDFRIFDFSNLGPALVLILISLIVLLCNSLDSR